jgi:hypothetical protein
MDRAGILEFPDVNRIGLDISGILFTFDTIFSRRKRTVSWTHGFAIKEDKNGSWNNR